MTSIGRDRMSECSAVVRLQVVHPVPAFFYFLENLYSQVALRIHVSIGTSKNNRKQQEES